MEAELKCDKCSSSQTTYRVKSKDRICYKCGNVFGEVGDEKCGRNVSQKDKDVYK